MTDFWLNIDKFLWPSVQRYVNDLTEEMGEHLENITQALTTFVDVGQQSQSGFVLLICSHS